MQSLLMVKFTGEDILIISGFGGNGIRGRRGREIIPEFDSIRLL